MRNIFHGIAIGFAVTAFIALFGIAVAGLRNADLRSSTELTEFFLTGNQIVETVTCASYNAHVDFQGYGNVAGENCSITAPYPPVNGTLGNTDVSFSMIGGEKLTLHGCRADSSYNSPGYHSLTINCLHIP